MSRNEKVQRAQDCRTKLKEWIDNMSDMRAIHLWEEWVEWIFLSNHQDEESKSKSKPKSI